MPTSHARKTRAAEAARRRRETMRAKVMREVAPDTRSATFAEEARRQSLAVANGPGEKEDQDFVDAITAPWDE